MKKLLTVLAFFAVSLCSSLIGIAQTYIDSGFTVSASIKPSDYAQWPDGVAAWRVYANYDLDDDGKKEFLVIVDPASTSADTSMPRILRFEASGNDQYDLVWSAQIPGERSGLFSWPCISVSDLDKDGNQEIIFGLPTDGAIGPTPTPDRIFIYEYDPDSSNFLSEPTFTSDLAFPSGFYYAITSIVADDVDEDGDVELVLSARRAYGGGSGNSSTRPLHIFHLTGDDLSSPFTSLELEFADTIGTFNGGYYFNNHVVDFDDDGKKEIWGFTWDMIAYAVYEATGKDTYVLQAEVNQATNPLDWGEQNSVSFYDANNDGKLEMFMAAQNGTTPAPDPQSALFYLPNTTDLASLDTSSEKQISLGYVDRFFQGAEAGDLDGDGEVEFYVGDWSSERKVYRLRHLNGMPFDDPSGYILDTLYYATNDSNYVLTNVTIGHDLDGDNKRELIIVNTDTRTDHPEDVSLIILENKVAVLSVRTISEATPKSFSLEQNYPNPFNPSSTIRFSLMTGSNVEVFISNSLGQRVATLINKKMDTGSHEVTFNADGLASGTYFYTLKAGAFTETKKMVLMK